MSNPREFSGAITALVTPFRNGQIAHDDLDRLVDAQIAGGIKGLVPVGTTGESPTLDYDEHIEVIRRVVARTAGRVPVIAGTGAPCASIRNCPAAASARTSSSVRPMPSARAANETP